MDAAKRVLLDACGVMQAASGMAAEVQPFVTLAALSGSGPCRIFGSEAKASAPMAALANGAMAHAMDFEDSFDQVPGHPNASLVPALIALAQAEGPVDGRRFLTALVAGCEVSCRLALALRQDMEEGGWYPPPIVAGLGAAVGAAKLLGLDAAGMQDALSLALCQVTMPGEIKYSQGTVIRAVREAFPAQAAVQSALLAREGLRGFEQPLEGRSGFYALFANGQFDSAVLTADFAAPFNIQQLTFKAWPSCRGTHPFIEMALDLRHKHAIVPGDIAGITVHVDAVQRMLVEPAARKSAPQTAIDAKFSIPFCAASALATGRVDLDSFSADRLADQQVLALARRVVAMEAVSPNWQRGSGGSLELRLRDGRVLTNETNDALGCPARPLDEPHLLAKFTDCLSRSAQPLMPEAARALAGRILSLEQCSDVGALLVGITSMPQSTIRDVSKIVADQVSSRK